MNKLVLIFDYFKEAFHINKANKSLYKPQLALIAVKVVLMLFVGIGVYTWVATGNIISITTMEPEQIIGFMLSQGFKLLAIILAYALITVVIESGLLNMYKGAVTRGYIESGDFKEGLSKYFLKLLLGEILIIVCALLALPFYLLLGLVTLTVGLTVIPIVFGVFFTMWKVSLVMNDTGIIESIKDSFRFAKKNFVPLAVLQIIHWAFSKGVSSGGGGGSNFNVPDTNNFNNDFGNAPIDMPGFAEVIRIIKLVIAILLPIISIAIIVGSIIAMIFEVFFSLTLFVTYKNGFKVEEKPLAIIEESTETNVAENYDGTEANDFLLEDAPVSDDIDNQSNDDEASDKEVEQ